MTAIALLSGGLDSTVAAALWVAAGGRLGLGLFVDYGQRAARAEERAAVAVGHELGIEVVLTALPLLEQISTSSLMEAAGELPRPALADLDDTAVAEASAAAVWVPNRNGVLVNLAAAVAEARGFDVVLTGFNAEEAVSFPDNGRPFVEALNACLAHSTRNAVRVESPTVGFSKTELLAAGLEVGAPVALTWSCYEGGSEPCGTCESCRRRQRAEAGVAI